MKTSIGFMTLSALAFSFASALAMADGGTALVCKSVHPSSGGSTIVDIHLTSVESDGSCAGRFNYVSETNGSYPTQDTAMGSISGTLSRSDAGIDADFAFTAFGVPSRLVIRDSRGEVIIGNPGGNPGAHDIADELQCSEQ